MGEHLMAVINDSHIIFNANANASPAVIDLRLALGNANDR